MTTPQFSRARPEDGPRSAAPPTSEAPTVPPAAPEAATSSTRKGVEPASGPPAAESTAVAVPGYEIMDVLGAGGMGIVYLARQQGLNRLVALKTIRGHYADDPQALARFRREAEAVARLAHPHIVPVYDWGEYDGVPYFALEYCTGGSLHSHLADLPGRPAEAARLVEKLARAVQAAHDQGIVHRDLKPANVLLAPAGDEPALNTPWGVPKVADFGLCRLLGADVQRTADGTVAGSPPYMAPEQAEGRMSAIGPATDVWALGVILYEVLTGRQPFEGETMPAILYRICHDEPPQPRELRPGLPAGLEAICLRCLRKRPEERYARAGDLAEALRDWHRKPVAKRARSLQNRSWVVAGVLLAGLLGLGVWAWLGRTPSDSSRDSAGNDVGTTRAETRPLSIRLHVFRLTGDGSNPRLLGELGKAVYRVRLNERVEVEAELSEPAYAYLIAFNPAQKPADLEQLLPRSEADLRPAQRARLAPDSRLKLDDGEGLQAFAVVASRRPLPAYAEWRKQRPPLTWQPAPASLGVVWHADGTKVEGFFDPDFPRATEEKVGDKVVIDHLARQLRGMPDVEAVEVVGFAVDRPK